MIPANGKKITLSATGNGELAEEASVIITKTADGKLVYQLRDNEAGANNFNTLSTAKGETYSVRLPDGTSVWLNAASSIRYPSSFKGVRYRKIILTGEAYFEVAKDKAHPFIVATSGQEIQVLGTHFSISAYQDESETKTTLLEGAVQVKTAGQNKLLKPGDQSVFAKNTLIVSKADIRSAVAWKKGEFIFNGESITEVMQDLSRWYNVEVIYQGPVTDEGFQGKILRQKSITEVLELLELTDAVHFKIEGRKIIVSK